MNADKIIATLIVLIVAALVGPYYVAHPPQSHAEQNQARHFADGLDSSTIHTMIENHVAGF